jgi:spermidine synthase
MTPSLRTLVVLAAGLLAALAAPAPAHAAERIIHEENSLYRNILVRQRGDERCLLFTVRRTDRNQSCMDLSQPDRLVFPYARMTFAGFLVEPDPKRLLMVGLGGGSLVRAFDALYPELEQDVVEIDGAVVRVAREFFRYEDSERVRTHVRDARVFVKRELARGAQYDVVLLDAFTGDYIPEHLMTREFLEEVKGILRPGGVVVANTFASSRLYDHESATYDAVFEHIAELRLPITLNRILVATDADWPDEETLQARAEALAPRVAPFGVEPRTLADALTRDFDYGDARVLTDQYSPVNLLQ